MFRSDHFQNDDVMGNYNDMNANKKYKVLFVCLGNICRSPAAQGVFEHIVRENGISLTHRSRQVSGLDFLDFDLIVAMDDQNYEDLMHMAPSVEATHKVKRMAEFLRLNRMSYVPDPYYMGMDGFGLVLDLLEDGCRNLFEVIVKAEF